MHAAPLTLKQIFEHDRRYVVPMFQRPYVWSAEKQWQPLWDDVRAVAERLASAGADVPPHFLGAIVLEQVPHPVSRVETRLLVDGQQRLTTLQLLLEAATDICRQRGWDRYCRAFGKLTRNEDPLSEDPDDVFKVWPTNVDQHVFRSVMEAASREDLEARLSTSTAALASPIAQAYVFFTSAITEWLPEDDQRAAEHMGHLHSALREWLRLVVIDLDGADDPQMIFETLNARGTPLLPADLVKNHLFHLARRAELDVERLHRLYWRHFDEEGKYWRDEIAAGRVTRSRIDLYLQHYLAMATGDEVQVTHLYASFQRYFGRGGRAVDEELAAVARYSHVFRRFDETNAESRLGRFFARLEDMQITTAHPLLLHLLGLELAPADLEAVLVSIESFLVRRLVCHLTTKAYNRVFLEVLNAVRNVPAGVPGAVEERLLAGTGDSARWPADQEFRAAWLEMPTYRILARRRASMLLEAMELASRGGEAEGLRLSGKLTIEHVLPQSWEAHWPLAPIGDPVQARAERERLVHTIGNLTLVTAGLNAMESNGPWPDKQSKLRANSLLMLNRTLWELPGWDETAIRERGEKLLGLALRVWPRPSRPGDHGEAVPSYVEQGRRLARRPPEDAPGRAHGKPVACPIPGCGHVFKHGPMGWDGHIGGLKKHPAWHPEVTDPGARRRLFRMEFPEFMSDTDFAAAAARREYWERRSDSRALAVVEALGPLLEQAGVTPQWSYNRHFVSFGGPHRKLAWLRPRRSGPYCHMRIRSEQEVAARVVADLRRAGMTAVVGEKGYARLELTVEQLTAHREVLQALLDSAIRRAGE